MDIQKDFDAYTLISMMFENASIDSFKPLWQLTFAPAVCKDSLFSTTSLSSLVCRLFDMAILTGVR